jgi:hypothetical protein
MPTIFLVGGLKVQVFADDHHPPHFHITGPEIQVLVRIDDLSILHGDRHRRQVREVLAWADGNRDILWTAWAQLNDER